MRVDKKSSKTRRPLEELDDEATRDPWYSMLWQVIADNWNRPPGDRDTNINDHDFGGLDWGDSD